MTIEPSGSVIKHGETETKVTFKAAADSALGDFTIKVTGHPGPKGSRRFGYAIQNQHREVIPDVAAKAKRDEYDREMPQATGGNLDARIQRH